MFDMKVCIPVVVDTLPVQGEKLFNCSRRILVGV